MDESIKGMYAHQLGVVSYEQGLEIIEYVKTQTDDQVFIKLLEEVNNNK